MRSFLLLVLSAASRSRFLLPLREG